MSKLGNWRNDNWYWDRGWQKREVLALLRRNWKHLYKVRQQRERSVQSEQWWWPADREPPEGWAEARRLKIRQALVRVRMKEWLAARATRDFETADRLRNEVRSLGGNAAVSEMQKKRASLG